ncbi:MAG: AMP-binding protein [Ignavibacteriaceae bacterium]|nr:AMP-binding protein [Ignavibacteriaceae bacterium]
MKKLPALKEVDYISSIQDMIIQSEKKYANKLALEDLTNTPIQSLTYTELLNNILRFGNALVNLGIPERTHIALIGENRVQWGLAYLTLLSFNYVVVPIDKNLSSNEILNIIHESDAEAIILTEQFESLIRDEISVLKKLKYCISMDTREKNNTFYSMTELIRKSDKHQIDKLPHISPTDTAEIIFTSGSLGRAKGVMLSQQNLSANLMGMRQIILIKPEDRFLSVLPIHHTYECTCGFLCPMYSGSSVHYARSLKTVVEDLQKVKATILLAVPLLYDKMFKRIYKAINDDKVKSKIIKPLIKVTDAFEKIGWKDSKKKIFGEIHNRFGGSIRLFIAGGAAPDPKVAKGLGEFGFTFIQGYGLTETSPILTLNPIEFYKDDSAGIPLPGVELKIHDKDSDGIGEVYARGKSVMAGYYKNSQLTEQSFDGDWFKTGDLGYIDSDGFLHISGRKKNVIIANNGKNVFPEEIEDILNRSPFVMESLVYGEKHDKHDEIIAAQIVIDSEAFIEYGNKLNQQITEELIQQTISRVIKETNQQLTSFKQIKKFVVRQKEFEKTTTQKIKRYLVNNDQLVEN